MAEWYFCQNGTKSRNTSRINFDIRFVRGVAITPANIQDGERINNN